MVLPSRVYQTVSTRSRAAKRKNTRLRTDEGTAVTSWRDLLRHLATLSRNTVALPKNPDYAFTVTAAPTQLQQKAFDLLGVKPIRPQ